MSDISGINASNLQCWFNEHAEGVINDLSFTPVVGGHSNLTYIVTDQSSQKWVLRRPPLGHVLATAHDMSREHKIISALSDSGVPVPGVIGLCEDLEINDAPFYVMNFVPGDILRTRPEAEKLSDEVR